MTNARRSLFVLVAALVGLLVAPPGPRPAEAVPATPTGGEVVETETGPVRGVVAEEYRLFLGIPFAAPPVGDLRWRSPQPSQPWSTPLDATTPGNRCPQVGDAYNGPFSEDEDCLYLSVTTPVSAVPDRPKPVIVWLHGGGFVGGAGSDYDARRLAVAGDVVVVAPNYRLGVFGFFGHPELGRAGAFGLEDQQAALRWVRRNAAAFGGDPGNVTLMGESAGGVSICAHLVSPAAAGLFHRAVLQSGPCLGDAPSNTVFPGVPEFSPWPRVEEIAAIGAEAAPAVGCADPATALACLRRLPAAALLPGSAFFGRPAVGTPVLPVDPRQALAAGRFRAVPILSGHTRDEGTLWASFHPQPITAERYRALLGEAFGNAAERIAARYPAADFATPGLAWAAVVSDRVWACPALAGHHLFTERVPTFVFRFDDRGAPRIFPEVAAIPLGAYHGSELPSLFDGGGIGDPAPLNPEQRLLSDRMVRYWANFAATGDPNGGDLPPWPAFAADDPTPSVQGLAPGAAGIAPVDPAADHRCGFWAAIAPWS